MRGVIWVALSLLSAQAFGSTLFSEDFETDLSAWTGTGGGAHSGVIVSDVLQADNALTFTALNSGGDIFTASTFTSASGKFQLSYDYLGTCSNGDCGGFIGYSFNLPGAHVWLVGTSLGGGVLSDDNLDTGQWHSVKIVFDAGANANIHLMVEDWQGSGGVAGDAYFDNVQLQSVPIPAAIWLFGAGLVGLVRYKLF